MGDPLPLCLAGDHDVPETSPEYVSFHDSDEDLRTYHSDPNSPYVLPDDVMERVPVEVHPQVIFNLPHHVLDFTAGPSKKHGRDDDAGQAGPSSSSKLTKPTLDQKGGSWSRKSIKYATYFSSDGNQVRVSKTLAECELIHYFPTICGNNYRFVPKGLRNCYMALRNVQRLS
ncbi:hypothetical protein BJ742DRAFT_31606 [Cladochytrium replicatum]|nr:hypothetical protein BJ742DRAFT_31606 [Cladochytrium replicatum]